MSKQTTFKEIPEIKAYKELKIQIEAEQRKLTETETKLTNMKSSIKELEGKISESELNKQKNMERFALGEISQSELNKAKKQHLEAVQEYNDTKELVEIMESVIEKQKKILLNLQREMLTTSSAVWDKIADEFQKKLEASVGETAKFLWVAMMSANHHNRPIRPHELPERVRIFATPERDEVTKLQEKLWNEFVEEN